MSSPSDKRSKLAQLMSKRSSDWKELQRSFVAQQHDQLRTQRADIQQTARQNSGAKFNLVMSELASKRTDIQRLSATRSSDVQSVAEHNRYLSTMLDSTGKQGMTHAEYANKRYGNSGAPMLQQLARIGPGMEDLITDPVLMSKTHLADFTEFASAVAQSRHKADKTALSPWQMRSEYEATLPQQTWYRGLQLPADVGPEMMEKGIASRVSRSLDGLKAGEQTGSDKKTRGIFRQMFDPREGDMLPKLDEAFDKPIQAVIGHRVHKLTRSLHADFEPVEMPMRKSAFEKTLTSSVWKALSVEEQKRYGSFQGYRNKKYSEHVAELTARRQARGKRIDDEANTQSVTRYPEVGAGFGGSDLFGGGSPTVNKPVFNYHMQLSPLEVLSPQDWVSPKSMSSGVQVGGRPIPNSPSLESITLGRIQPRQMKSVQTHVSPKTIPEFKALE